MRVPLLRLERLEPVNELVDLCQGVLRGAFGDATAEGMLANPNLAIAFSLGPITRTCGSIDRRPTD